MQEPQISTILHRAADFHLPLEHGYSCDAIMDAVHEYFGWPNFDQAENFLDRVKKGLCEMGLNTSAFNAFSDIEDDADRQCVRYAWLKFAAMIAEEQGV